MDKSTYESRLYKLCCEENPDYEDCLCEFVQWINDKQLCVWVNYIYLESFIAELKNIFGAGIFDDGGFNANMQEDCVCIDLCEAVGECIDIESVFPKNKFMWELI